LVKKIKLAFEEDLKIFQNYVFKRIGAENHKDFSRKLISKQVAENNLAAKLQDEILNSDEFKSFCNHNGWKKLAANLLKKPTDDVIIVYPHFRIDLPLKFKDDHQKMSLPWHQEAGYYLKLGKCSPKSIVLSTYIHDCLKENGAVAIGRGEVTDLVDHDEDFLDKSEQRFYRVTCEEPSKYENIETVLGEAIAFDFLIPHRSGLNVSQDVRLTFLLRASSLSDIKQWEAIS
jgi:hypothetical protein